jgi:magnesium-transporting ATPase (P-type)
VNTSELTGESKPITATVESTSETFMESRNIGFYSSMVEQGTGEAVVIATGDSTVLGKMSRLTRGSSGDEITGLHREVNRFVLFVVLATITGIIILWITWAAWLNRVHPGFVTYNDNIVNSVAMIVAFLPLGLPSAVTLGKSIFDVFDELNEENFKIIKHFIAYCFTIILVHIMYTSFYIV